MRPDQDFRSGAEDHALRRPRPPARSDPGTPLPPRRARRKQMF